tara:strand:- start:83 stop:994 length:912 start_codon:yes stop_codon:yes gene_type:complete
MKLNLAEIDCIFLSYDEPNAEANWSDLLNKAPWAKRVHGVKGSDAAHKACARLSETENFITVDGDNIVDSNFFNLSIDTDKLPKKDKTQLSWAGKNIINGLVYGNGGLKVWTREFVLNMRTHEDSDNNTNQVDFCWQDDYVQMADCYSTVHNNASPLQAWRAGFREGVKMTLNKGLKQELTNPKKQLGLRNYRRLLMWCSVGADIDNGVWSILGARHGAYNTNCTDWDYVQVRDFEYLNNMFSQWSDLDPVYTSKRFGDELREKLHLPIADIDVASSKFFREVFVNPARTNTALLEKDVTWDL